MLANSKRLCIAVALLAIISSCGFSTASAASIITDAQIASIKMHCTDIQASLNTLHQNDVLLRYNRGELYRTIADKLMSPLNQRIASNQLDGGELVKITAQYNTAYQAFYDDYKVYEMSLNDARAIDCTKLQTKFYDQLGDASQKRIQLHDTNTKLVSLASDYKKEFERFKIQQLKAGN